MQSVGFKPMTSLLQAPCSTKRKLCEAQLKAIYHKISILQCSSNQNSEWKQSVLKMNRKIDSVIRQDDKPIGHPLVIHRKQKEICEKAQCPTYPVKFRKAEREGT